MPVNNQKKPVKKAAPKKVAAKSIKKKQQPTGFKRFVTARNAFIALAVVLVVSYVLGVYAAFTTSIIPGKYIGFGFLLSFVITIGIVYALIKRGPKAKYAKSVVVVAVLGIIANLVLFNVGTSTRQFINSLSESDSSQMVEYAIVGLKSEKVKLATSGLSIAVQERDNTEPVKQGIANHMSTPRITAVPSAADGIVALQQHTSPTALYTMAYLTDLKERSNNELYLQLEILATFKVKVTSSEAANADVTKPYIVYISGLDTYGAIDTTSRSDVNIMAVVNPRSHEILFVNTPRDYYVQLNGTTGLKDKLTHAGLYGVDMSVKTLENLYKVDINYNVKINFTSLEKVVDALGGIDVYSEYNFSSQGYSFAVGKNSLNGKQALAFSRERYSFDGGDRTRGQNQMRVLAAIINKLSQPSVIVNYQNVLSAMSGLFQTNMSSDTTASLVRTQLNDAAKWTTSSMSVDGTGASEPTYSMGSQRLYVMVPNQASVDAAKAAINATLARTK